MVAAAGGIAERLLPAEELVVDFLDAAEFGDGLGMVVDAEVDVAVVCAAVAPAIADDEECGGLLAAFVATGGLACGEGVDERTARFPLEARKAFDMASTTSGPVRMLPWTAWFSPVSLLADDRSPHRA